MFAALNQELARDVNVIFVWPAVYNPVVDPQQKLSLMDEINSVVCTYVWIPEFLKTLQSARRLVQGIGVCTSEGVDVSIFFIQGGLTVATH